MDIYVNISQRTAAHWKKCLVENEPEKSDTSIFNPEFQLIQADIFLSVELFILNLAYCYLERAKLKLFFSENY